MFVLLGEPGMGKSETMKALASLVLGESGEPIPTNDFIVLPASPDDAARPMFIDALDEARASGDTTVWGELRRSIAKNRLTRFGVACRVADWHNTDAQDLAAVVQGQHIRVFALNPLTTEQSQAVLRSENIEDTKNFEQQAQVLGFSDMLGNPQSLKLLVTSVKNNQGRWPKTRRDAYELACRALVQEANKRHRQARKSEALLSEEALLDAAGWLCSLMLLSNQKEVTDEALDIDDHEGVRLAEVLGALPVNSFAENSIRQVLQRRLFIKPSGYAATHRTVAEYLAARYISKRISHAGLLPGRVASLMLASSKHLVGNLRGLAGWLAALSEPMRITIFEADPAAVLDYGDLHLLSPADKKALVDQLVQSPVTGSGANLWRKVAQHVPLVQSDMQTFAKNWLESYKASAPRSRQQTLVADILLSALIHVPATPFWEPVLTALVRDEGLAEGDRSLALSALFTHHPTPSALCAVLEDIHFGRLGDSTGRLTNSLLQYLYPKHIGPSDVLRYLKPAHVRPDSVKFPWFWGHQIEMQTPAKLIPELMDAMEQATRTGAFEDKVFRTSTYRLKGLESLVTSAIEMFGESIEVPQLSRWLQLCTNTSSAPFRQMTTENALRLKQWSLAHPNLIKKVMSRWVQEGASSWEAQYRIPNDHRPSDLGAFWLEQALELHSKGEPIRACDCLDTAFSWIDRKDGGISLEDLENAVKQNDVLQSRLESLLCSPLSDDNLKRKHWLDDREYRDEMAAKSAQDEETRMHLLGHLSDIRSGKLRNYLSDAAWQDLKDSGYAGGLDGHLLDLWREEHPELKEATCQGYQAILNQLTFSQATSVVKNHKTGHILNIELPCLLAAQQLYAASPQTFFDLGEERLKALLTVHLLNHCNDHDWLVALFGRHPDWCEEVWWSLCASALRSKKDIRIPQIGLLRHEVPLRSMALRLLPRVLTVWPSKISDLNFPAFVQVLDAVLEQCSSEEVSQLVAKRLKLKSLGSHQTGYLLMAGLWVDHQTYAPMLESMLRKNQIVQTELLGFIGHLHRHGANPESLPAWDAPTRRLLFRILGPLCPAERPEGFKWVSAKDEGRALLHQLLDAFRNDTSEVAQRELLQLLSDPALIDWKERLEECFSRRSQFIAEQSFSLPSPLQVALTLQNKTPANPSDLMAVALDALHTVQQTLRNSDTNRLNRFWTVDTAGKRPRPPHLPEPECRNRIADWLRADLAAMDVSVVIENQHGAQNQSDIVLRVRTPTHEDMLLPIEIKGDWNRELWTAATEQLAKQYANEPRCHGQGIYLVLWLGSHRGDAKAPKQHPNHPTNTPADLQKHLQLEARQKSSDQDIRVVVLDVSIPD